MMNQTILIVDDNQDSLDLMREMLQPHDYEVLCATSGPEAVQLLQQSIPDLVILDIMMPDTNGFAALDCMGATPALKNIPVTGQNAFPPQPAIHTTHGPLLESPVKRAVRPEPVRRRFPWAPGSQHIEHFDHHRLKGHHRTAAFAITPHPRKP